MCTYIFWIYCSDLQSVVHLVQQRLQILIKIPESSLCSVQKIGVSDSVIYRIWYSDS